MSLQDLLEPLRAKLDGRVEADVTLGRFTTYRLGGPAALYVEPSSVSDLERSAEELMASDLSGVQVLPLGRGSNLVISDHGFPGLVVRLGPAFSWARSRAATGIEVGAAMSLPQLANWSARRGLAGVEWAISIPGSVGGGVRMNAGAHGGEIKDHLRSVKVWRMATSSVVERAVADLAMSYRRAAVAPDELVLEARFELVSEEQAAIRARMEAYRKHRSETQPGALQNAGSVFKNPVGDSAGRLVEAAGLKGFRVGGVKVSELHANFFVAEEGARAQDVYDLVAAVRAKVCEASGIDLETEIRFVGDFSGRDEPG